ncbi:hypothetical protein [Alicyclobacillus sp. ALC3]|uniref:hypothetical protein n=1 Tax=Alicyclobacillus sp. ALC3 TaxID=2796143 RepID=UPI00237893C4|nr:hypothetical protein [Alicyclobacillus sp. ALC3]WDL97037.1 hypothetical protein JC200_22650 [Alicyclobacillus sp. ALC3]
MRLQVLFALLIGAGVLLLVGRSIFSQWRGADKGVPLRGKYRAAMEWLEGNGYRVLRARERSTWVGYYGDREFQKQLIADFIVRQGAKTYAVKLASSREKGISGAKLRDSWFPLYVLFGVQGILHIDVEHEVVQVVDFDLKPPSRVVWARVINRFLWLLGGALLALVVMHA